LVLPNGATTIDFAYAVHTEVGNHCVGAKINSRNVPLNTKVKNGDIVSIMTSSQSTPSRDWMQIAKSTKTRSKIRNYFRQAEKTDREGKLTRGWEFLERELKKRGIPADDMEEFSPALNKVARDLGLMGKEDLLVAIGSGSAGPSTVAQKLALAHLQQRNPSDDLESLLSSHVLPKRPDLDIIVDGYEGVQVVRANCCEPVPGDSIVGYSTRTRGITVHRMDCLNILNAQMGQVVRVDWNTSPGSGAGKFYTTRIKAEAVDRENLVRDIAQVIGQANGSIHGMKVSIVDNSLVRIKIELRVRNLEHLYEITGKLNGVKGMMEVCRG
jgi:GTP pyrophosphokinase